MLIFIKTSHAGSIHDSLKCALQNWLPDRGAMTSGASILRHSISVPPALKTLGVFINNKVRTRKPEFYFHFLWQIIRSTKNNTKACRPLIYSKTLRGHLSNERGHQLELSNERGHQLERPHCWRPLCLPL